MRSVLHGLKRLVFIAMLAGMLSTASVVIPQGWNAANILLFKDALQLTRFRLAQLSADDYALHLEQALSEQDIELARSLLTLADQQGVVLAPELPEQVAAQETWSATAMRNSADIWQGISTGRADSGAGLAAATISDFTLFGDVRDLVQ